MQRESARYKIGPLTTYADVKDLEKWLHIAASGEKVVYAIGPALGREAATPKLARRWADEGKVRLHRDGSKYIMARRHPTDVQDSHGGNAAKARGEELRLLDVIARLAEQAKRLPVLEVLAELAGLSTKQSADYRLRNLQNAGLLRIAIDDDGVRVAEIVATGAKTRGKT